MNDAVDVTVRFEEADLYSLVSPERDIAIDALSAGKEFPFVIVGETLACSGEIDFGSIETVIRGRLLM